MYQQIQDLLNTIGPYPEKPRKPVLLTGANSEAIRAYADAFAEFEKKFAEFEVSRSEYYKRKSQVEAQVVELIKKESGFYSIPEKYQSKVWNFAWEEGNGYYEAYNFLERMVDIFD